MGFYSEPWHEKEVASSPLSFSDNSALFILWLCACKLIFMLLALSFRSVWGPTANCFIIVICACIFVGEGVCVTFAFFVVAQCLDFPVGDCSTSAGFFW